MAYRRPHGRLISSLVCVDLPVVGADSAVGVLSQSDDMLTVEGT